MRIVELVPTFLLWRSFKALGYFYQVNSCILFFWALSSVFQLLQMSYDAGSMKCYQILNSLIMSYRPWL
jgi:hypothetical protein